LVRKLYTKGVPFSFPFFSFLLLELAGMAHIKSEDPYLPTFFFSLPPFPVFSYSIHSMSVVVSMSLVYSGPVSSHLCVPLPPPPSLSPPPPETLKVESNYTTPLAFLFPPPPPSTLLSLPPQRIERIGRTTESPPFSLMLLTSNFPTKIGAYDGNPFLVESHFFPPLRATRIFQSPQNLNHACPLFFSFPPSPKEVYQHS